MDLLSVLTGQQQQLVRADSQVSYAVYPGAQHEGEDLEVLAARCMAHLVPYLEGYIWQQDRFTLTPSTTAPAPWTTKRTGQQQQGPPCLWGCITFGDNVEDEWFVTWLLAELTSALPGLAARVWDEDGDFLLIEAAYALPRWLKPENSRHRVWLWQGRVHLIPQPSARHPHLPAFPTLADALGILSDGRTQTQYPKVQEAISRRMDGYPAAAHAYMHTARALLPPAAAWVLQQHPQLVAEAVAAFCTRTCEEQGAASRLADFPPTSFTPALVRMNRCQYAQLLQQEYSPPKGYQPPGETPGGVLTKAARLGLKLTTGLQLVLTRGGKHHAGGAAGNTSKGSPAAAGSSSTRSSGNGASSSSRGADVRSHPAWPAYQRSLTALGYHRGNLEGSAEYRKLQAAAEAAFQSSQSYSQTNTELAAPAVLLTQLQQQYQAAGCPAVAPAQGPGDSDEWLAEAGGQLDAELAAREAELAKYEAHKAQRAQQARGGAATGSHHQQQQQVEDDVELDEMADTIRGFMQHTATCQGAEVPHSSAAYGSTGGRGSRGLHSSSGNSAPLGSPPAPQAAAPRTQQHKPAASSKAAAAGASGKENLPGVDFDTAAFLGALGSILGATSAAGAGPRGLEQLRGLQQQLQQVEAALTAAGGAGSGQDSDEEEVGSSSEEGSSFYSGSGSEDEAEEGRTPTGAAAEGWSPSRPSAAAAAAAAAGAWGMDKGGLQQQPPAAAAPPPPPQRAARPAATAAGAGGAKASAAAAAPWPEVLTETDSDDPADSALEGSGSEDDSASIGGDDEEFMQAYSQALEQQLGSTHLAATFNQQQQQQQEGPGASAGGTSGRASSKAAQQPPSQQQQQQQQQRLAPVDLDMNLVRSLMDSVAAQGGLPGPASNMAGLLGLALPGTKASTGRPGAGA